MDERIKTIVIGWLNTDIVALGLEKFPSPGQHVYGEELKIGPGGKSRNIADMISVLSKPNTVAMVGKTIKDPYGLWELPVEALKENGVNTQFIKVLPYKKGGELPSVVLIAVDHRGRNLLYALPGIGNDFNETDIDDAQGLFNTVAKNRGFLVVSLECPIGTAEYAISKATDMGIRVLLDPGGITPEVPLKKILACKPYLIKPNEHEATVLTGVNIVDSDTAALAAKKLRSFVIENVFVTVGEKGAFLF